MNIIYIVIIIFIIFTIISKYKSRKAFLILKPFTTILIIMLAVLNLSESHIELGIGILAGLIFSLLGDVFLMFEKKYFLHGLVAFLITHIFYALAFITGSEFFYGGLIPLLLFSIFIYLIIRQGLGKYNIPVIIYMLIASSMVWMAINRFLTYKDTSSIFILCGSILFILSDGMLAINKFRREVKFAEVFILGSYYAAQFFIAMSAGIS